MNEKTFTVETVVSKSNTAKNFIKSKAKIIGITLLLVLPIFSLVAVVRNTQLQNNNVKAADSNIKTSFVLNKEYTFPLKDDQNNEVGKIKYTIENAQLMDEIIIKGQKATAVDGKTFLIINLKLTNSLNQSVQIDTRDYIRLVFDGKNQDLIAPDIHNDPVEVQPISTKFTRVGLPINKDFKNIQLKVGEINGDKSTLDIKF